MITSILISHFLGDFCSQTRRVFSQKRAFNLPLAEHCLLYTLFLCPASLYFMGNDAYTFLAINFVGHYAVDGWTSEFGRKLLNGFKFDKFFVFLGFDQLLHAIFLVNTL